MTLIAGMNLGEYALLGADTRVTLKYPDGTVEIDDNAEKIYRFDLGLIAGAGLESLVQSAIGRTNSVDVAHIDDLMVIIEDERAQTLNGEGDADVRDGIKATSWMFTYLAARNNNRPQLATTSPASPQHWVPVPLNCTWILSPAGATLEQIQEWLAFLQANLRPLEQPGDTQANIKHHCEVVGRLMRTVSQVNSSVAATFRVGVHSAPNRIGISGVCHHNGTDLIGM